MNTGISFIVIGKNEGWKISKCLDSIYSCIEKNRISNYEIIYVDSQSNDDSIERVKKYKEVKIYSIINKTNAAIARNIGAKESLKDVLFFIDGDMEIIAETVGILYNNKYGLLNNFTSGDFENQYYSKNGKFINRRLHYNLQENIYETTTGGLFLITRKLWNHIGGMKCHFRISEDWDLGLRMAFQDNRLYRVKEVLAFHHTESYNSKDRFWADVLKGDFLYYKALLYRSHIHNKYMYRLLIREVTLFSLLGFVFLAIYLKNPYYLCLYFFIILVKTFYKKNKIDANMVSLYFRYIVFDLGTLLAFFFFWPKAFDKLEYERIN